MGALIVLIIISIPIALFITIGIAGVRYDKKHGIKRDFEVEHNTDGVNPTTGYPMISGTHVDVGGNSFGSGEW
ncbi:MAG: hypothetical protein ACYCSB_04115 [bacterium]